VGCWVDGPGSVSGTHVSFSFSGYHAYDGTGVNLASYLWKMSEVSYVARHFVAGGEYSGNISCEI
jgi:hypothetical protein